MSQTAEGLCEHERVIGHVCLDCPSGTAEDEMKPDIFDEGQMMEADLSSSQFSACTGNSAARYDCMMEDSCKCERQATGLDAPYYDIPPSVTCIQDAVEYLGLNFANGNILKSLWREHGTQTKATDPIYEAEKRLYFANREYERVRGCHEMERAGQRLRKDGEKAGMSRLRGTHDESEESK